MDVQGAVDLMRSLRLAGCQPNGNAPSYVGRTGHSRVLACCYRINSPPYPADAIALIP